MGVDPSSSARRRRRVAPSERYQLYLQVLTGQATQRFPSPVFPQVLIADTAGNPARQIRCFIDDHDHGHDEAAG